MDQTSSSAGTERRNRHPVCLDARLIRADGEAFDSVVSDLSLDGCCVTGTYPIGERVTIHLARVGVMTGQVRWSFANRSGVRFLREAR